MNVRKRESAKTALFTPEGELLILRRSIFSRRRPLTWDWPGGSLKVGKREQPEAGAIREVQEEAGLTINTLHRLGVYSRYTRGLTVTSYLFASVLPISIEDVELSREHTACSLVGVEGLPDLRIPKRFIHAVQENAALIEGMIQEFKSQQLN